MEPGNLFCFGLGYTAGRLARTLAADGWSVAGTCRSAEQAAHLSEQGFRMHLFDGTSRPAAAEAWFDGVTHVLVSVPPGPDGDPVAEHFGAAVAGLSSLAWLGYLSTTGVYGNTDGQWVDETAQLKPDVPRSARRVAAEQAWQDLAGGRGLPLHIFRLPGIYGPGRSTLDQVRAGKARRIVKPGHKFSRIHVDDIGRALRASMARPNPGAIYNVCDDEPAAPADVTAFACGLVGADPPPPIPFDEAAKTMSPMGLSFWLDNRRVRNDRIKEELGVELAYPSFREGLTAIFQSERE